MRTKYFYYISSNKVYMLSEQLNNLKFKVSKVTPKIGVKDFGFEASIDTNISPSLVKETVSLIEKMEKKRLIKTLGKETNLNTRGFWHNIDIWHNGIHSFDIAGSSRLRGGLVTSYYLWKLHKNNLILLVGSPANILGGIKSKEISKGYVEAPKEYVTHEFVESIFKVAADINDILAMPQKHVIINEVNTDTKDPIVINDTDSREKIEFTHILPYSNAAALGILCLKYLSALPKTEIDTVFKLQYRVDMEKPKDLPVWISYLESLKDETKNFNTGKLELAKEHFFGSPIFEKIRSIYVGSPIYTAIL